MVQKKIQKRNVFDATGSFMGATAALATGIPGEKCDTAPSVEHTYTTASATKYGNYADGGIVVNPKEGVRYGGSIADGLDVAAGTNVTVATKGHFFLKVKVGAAKAAIAKGASLYQSSGEIQTASAGSAIAKVLEAVSYPAAYATASTYNTGDRVSKDNATYTAKEDSVTGTWDASKWNKDPVEVGGDQFTLESSNYYVIVKAELV